VRETLCGRTDALQVDGPLCIFGHSILNGVKNTFFIIKVRLVWLPCLP